MRGALILLAPLALVACGPRADLDSALNEARAAGVPFTAAELTQPWPKPQNPGGDQLQLLAQEYDDSPDLAGITSALDRGDWRSAERMLAPHADAIRDARKFGEHDAIVAQRDWDQSVNLTFPEYAGIRSAAKLLAASARTHAVAGRRDAAASDLEALFGLTNPLGADHMIISDMVRCAIEAIGYRETLVVAQARPRDAAWLKRMSDALPKRPNAVPLREVWRTEAYMSVAILRNLENLPSDANFEDWIADYPEVPRTDGFPKGRGSQSGMVAALVYWRTMLEAEATGGEPQDWNQVTASALQAAKDTAGAHETIMEILAPVLSQAVDARAQTTARLATTRAAIKAAEYRSRQGRWPRDLAEIGADADAPFGDGKLKYSAQGNTVKVWSIGRDRRDDGGTPQTAQDGPEDVVAEIKR